MVAIYGVTLVEQENQGNIRVLIYRKRRKTFFQDWQIFHLHLGGHTFTNLQLFGDPPKLTLPFEILIPLGYALHGNHRYQIGNSYWWGTRESGSISDPGPHWVLLSPSQKATGPLKMGPLETCLISQCSRKLDYSSMGGVLGGLAVSAQRGADMVWNRDTIDKDTSGYREWEEPGSNRHKEHREKSSWVLLWAFLWLILYSLACGTRKGSCAGLIDDHIVTNNPYEVTSISWKGYPKHSHNIILSVVFT